MKNFFVGYFTSPGAGLRYPVLGVEFKSSDNPEFDIDRFIDEMYTDNVVALIESWFKRGLHTATIQGNVFNFQKRYINSTTTINDIIRKGTNIAYVYDKTDKNWYMYEGFYAREMRYIQDRERMKKKAQDDFEKFVIGV